MDGVTCFTVVRRGGLNLNLNMAADIEKQIASRKIDANRPSDEKIIESIEMQLGRTIGSETVLVNF